MRTSSLAEPQRLPQRSPGTGQRDPRAHPAPSALCRAPRWHVSHSSGGDRADVTCHNAVCLRGVCRVWLMFQCIFPRNALSRDSGTLQQRRDDACGRWQHGPAEPFGTVYDAGGSQLPLARCAAQALCWGVGSCGSWLVPAQAAGTMVLPGSPTMSLPVTAPRACTVGMHREPAPRACTTSLHCEPAL